MRCEKCGFEWSITNTGVGIYSHCPSCSKEIIDAEKAKSFHLMKDFLRYIVLFYGVNIYTNKSLLINLISDLYGGEENIRRVYKRVILDDALSVKIYRLFFENQVADKNSYVNRFISELSESTLLDLRRCKEIVESFVFGLNIEFNCKINTEIYPSANRSKCLDKTGDLLVDALLQDIHYVDANSINVRKNLDRLGINCEVNSFYILKFLVTQEQWSHIMGTNPAWVKTEKAPVTQVSWNNAQLFIKNLRQFTRMKFALPSELELEIASDVIKKTKDIWDTQALWEWTKNWWCDEEEINIYPKGKNFGIDKIARRISNDSISIERMPIRPDNYSDEIGFRLIINI